MVKLRFLGYIAEKMGTREINIEISMPIKLSELLETIKGINMERAVVIVNNKAATPDTPIKNKDEIVIMPVIGGG